MAAERPLRVAVVAEYYPRPSDPALGVWAHRQAMAVQEHGVEVRVLALERPLPPLGALRGGPGRAAGVAAGRARRAPVRRARRHPGAVRALRVAAAPARIRDLGTVGRAARSAARSTSWTREWPFDLVHAHYAVPAGDAVLRWMRRRGQAAARGFGARGRPVVSRAPRPSAGARWSAATLRGGRRGDLEQRSRHAAASRSVTGPLFRLDTIHLGADLAAARPLAGPSRRS